MSRLNSRTVLMQFLVFLTQWILMLLGFYLLAVVIAPARVLDSAFAFERYFDAALKATFALMMSVLWLFIWDRQVKVFFYRRKERILS